MTSNKFPSFEHLKTNTLPSLFPDITPIPQIDVPSSSNSNDNNSSPPPLICSIKYSPRFTQAMDYLRAILQKNETDTERALYLSEICLRLNPANYTTWHFRRNCLHSLSLLQVVVEVGTEQDNDVVNRKCRYYDSELVQNDLKLTSDLGGSNPKNYQIWYHRRTLLESVFQQNTSSNTVLGNERNLEIAKKELLYINEVLDEDAKNYHAWSHRQCILNTLSNPELYESEIDKCHELIYKDPRNNSAWNHRWFLVHNIWGNSSSNDNNDDDGDTQPRRKKEMEYAIQCAAIDPYNESPWKYLIGLLKEECNKSTDDSLIDEYIEKLIQVEQLLSEKLKSINDNNNLKKSDDDDEATTTTKETQHKFTGRCYQLSSAYIDLLELKGSMIKEDSDPDTFQKAADVAHALATEYDHIRFRYWSWREQQLRMKIKIST